jgi:hypothetical protein
MSLLDKIDSAIRLAVCIPARDQMHTATAFDLWNLSQHLSSLGIESKLFVSPGTLIANQRHELVKSAQDWSATHVMFIDSDITFAPESVTQLLEHQQLIVGAAYSKRVAPFITTAWHSIDDWDTWVRISDESESLIQVEAMALGFCLIKTEVFDSIELPWFQLGFFSGQYTGEDIEFFRKAKQVNIPVFMDTLVTKELGHLGTYAFKVDCDN